MKKIILLMAFVATSLFADLNWVKYSAAIKQAKAENKIVMVMLSKQGCPACEYMKDIVFESENVMKEFNKHFIAVYIDIHDDYIPNGLTFIGTPTFHFLSKYETKIDRIDGGVNAKTFIDKLKELEVKH
ncbi:MAG: thioredoxin family protein [Sulfurimonas sp.]|jgi:thiol-disulfide isomerase/thioredoxin|nr:thioredoxin family protein [Sulfurimonas sp.]MBU3939080.1 thioredoxin family protein [bacterium]MBU4025598.1 thioredoxin family protein [bacterium]MBU4058045.1 thioredoxin family protein [bacterium]MBU4109904.1 thioredoxin family protein [bacterium]